MVHLHHNSKEVTEHHLKATHRKIATRTLVSIKYPCVLTIIGHNKDTKVIHLNNNPLPNQDTAAATAGHHQAQAMAE